MRCRYQAPPRAIVGLGILAVAVSCGRSTLPFRDLELSPCWPNCSATAGDADQVWDDWHDYVRTLELPTCAPGTTLVITSTDSVLDGGPGITSLAEAGATLSFVEALWWSQNIGGPFTIRFDPTVFTDVATPHILLDASQQNWPETIASTCIDGRNATVVIEVINPRDPLAMCSDHCGNFTLDHSQLIGVTWLTPYESRNLFGWHLAIMNGSQVAGCRLGTDGLTNTSPATYGSFQLGGATLGPGNAIGGGTWAVAASGAFALVGNYLGYDPVTRTSLSVYIAARIQGPGLVADNVFLANDIQCWVSDPLNATVRNNWFGRNPTGTTVEPSSTGVLVQHRRSGRQRRHWPGQQVHRNDESD